MARMHKTTKAAKRGKRVAPKHPRVESIGKGKLIDAIQMDCAKRGRKVNLAEVRDILDSMISLIQKNVAEGKQVSLVGFGAFVARDRKARMGRNPQTGAELTIAARRVPAFKAGKGFKDEVMATRK